MTNKKICYEPAEESKAATYRALKEILNENEAFRDINHFMFLARTAADIKLSGEAYMEDVMNMFLRQQPNNLFQKKYARYKELSKRGHEEIDDIIASYDYQRGKYIRERSDIGKLTQFPYLQEALSKYFSIKETTFEEGEYELYSKIMHETEEYKKISELLKDHEEKAVHPVNCDQFPFVTSLELAKDLLRKPEIALKVNQKIYPLKDTDIMNVGACVNDLPYILDGISPECKEQVWLPYASREKNKSRIKLIENAIKDKALPSHYNEHEMKPRVMFKDLAAWIKNNQDKFPEFPIPLPEFLKVKIKDRDCPKIPAGDKNKFVKQFVEILHPKAEAKEITLDVSLARELFAIRFGIRVEKSCKDGPIIINGNGTVVNNWGYDTITKLLNNAGLKNSSSGNKSKNAKLKLKQDIECLLEDVPSSDFEHLRELFNRMSL